MQSWSVGASVPISVLPTELYVGYALGPWDDPNCHVYNLLQLAATLSRTTRIAGHVLSLSSATQEREKKSNDEDQTPVSSKRRLGKVHYSVAVTRN
jgi:hypothetical protein